MNNCEICNHNLSWNHSYLQNAYKNTKKIPNNGIFHIKFAFKG